MTDETTFTSHLGEVLKVTDERLKRAAEVIGGMAETNAKLYITQAGAVDTGLLRNSITHGVEGGKTAISSYKADRPQRGETQVKRGTYDGVIPDQGDGLTIVIGSNVEYAPYVEMGTPNAKKPMAARPYLRPAIENHREQFKQVLQTEMQR